MNPKMIAMTLMCGLVLTSFLGGVAMAGHDNPCCHCPPPPVKIAFSGEDPCTCCKFCVDVCVPACCLEEVPCVVWRNGIFGRRIAMYRYECCGFGFDVVINHRGKYWVR